MHFIVVGYETYPKMKKRFFYQKNAFRSVFLSKKCLSKECFHVIGQPARCQYDWSCNFLAIFLAFLDARQWNLANDFRRRQWFWEKGKGYTETFRPRNRVRQIWWWLAKVRCKANDFSTLSWVNRPSKMTPFNQLVPAPQNPLQSESLVPRGEARGRPIRDGGEKGENLCAIPQASPIYFLGHIEREGAHSQNAPGISYGHLVRPAAQAGRSPG